MKTMRELLDTLPQKGTVDWIGLRSARRSPMSVVQDVLAITAAGLEGDHYHSRSGNRGVTLIQAEHLNVIASCLGGVSVTPESLRRNIVVRGINLLALKDKRIRIGEAVLDVTGLCHPCSLMEQVFGEGGYNAVRGHGGVTASIHQGGKISVGNAVKMIGSTESEET